MKEIKVLLGDLRHHTIGVHSTYLPIGIGYIATYLQKTILTHNFKLEIVTNPDEALNLIDEYNLIDEVLSTNCWN